MKLRNIYEIADELAPFALSKEYIEKFGAYDNSGMLVECGGEIGGVLFSLDLSAACIEMAKRMGMNCIFTHHPAIYAPLKRLSFVDGDPVFACAREGISVISAHLNLDAACGGIDESLMLGLGGKKADAVLDRLSLGGYGRVYDVEKSPLEGFTDRAKATFRTNRLIVYGNRPVKRVASFCGAGLTEEAVQFALENSADTLVSSDGKHHLIAQACGSGMNVVLLTHYASEFYGFTRFYERMKERVNIPCAIFADERLL